MIVCVLHCNLFSAVDFQRDSIFWKRGPGRSADTATMRKKKGERLYAPTFFVTCAAVSSTKAMAQKSSRKFSSSSSMAILRRQWLAWCVRNALPGGEEPEALAVRPQVLTSTA